MLYRNHRLVRTVPRSVDVILTLRAPSRVQDYRTAIFRKELWGTVRVTLL
jgi:hypothetical protein